MTVSDVLVDALQRVADVVHSVLADATEAELTYRPDPQANSAAWLVWHIARVQDAQIADVTGEEEVWISDGWVAKFQLPFERRATGYAMSAEDAGKVPGDRALLGEYFDAVHRHTLAYVERLGDGDLDRVVDEAWTPPVTLGVRLVSIVNDDAQHAGQASYVKGLARRAG
jgi:uncharacterized damage-inducible protein DinB